MLDHAAAAAAARRVLSEAPVQDMGDGTSQPAIRISVLVQEILKAANPDAAVIPAYDEQLAQDARYRLEIDVEDGPRGAHMSVTAHPGAVAIGVYAGRTELDEAQDEIEQTEPRVLVSGLVGHEGVWHLGLALCSAAMEAKRKVDADRPAVEAGV